MAQNNKIGCGTVFFIAACLVVGLTIAFWPRGDWIW